MTPGALAADWAKVHRVLAPAQSGFRDTRVMACEINQHKTGRVSYCFGWCNADNRNAPVTPPGDTTTNAEFVPFRNIPHARLTEAMDLLRDAASWAVENLGARAGA